MEKKNVNVQLVDLNFKFKESDFLSIDLKEKKVGMFFSEKRIYNPTANVFLTLKYTEETLSSKQAYFPYLSKSLPYCT